METFFSITLNLFSSILLICSSEQHHYKSFLPLKVIEIILYNIAIDFKISSKLVQNIPFSKILIKVIKV